MVRASLDLLGPGILALRLPSVVCGLGLLVLSLPLAIAAFRSRRAALGALAAFAVHERLIFYSQEARPYALALLCAAASFLLYLHMLRSPDDRRFRAGYILAAAATFYAHYLFGVVILVQALYLCLRRTLLVAHLRAWVETALLLAVALLPGCLQLLNIFGRRQSLAWMPPAGFTESAEIALGFIDLPIFLASVGAVGVASIAWGIQRPRPGSRPGLVVLWLVVPFLLIAGVSASFDFTLVHRRHLLAAVPAVCLLYGLLLSLPARRSPLAWLPCIVFLCAVVGLRLLPRQEQRGLFSERYASERWSQATRELLRGHRPGEPILYDTKFVELDSVARGDASPAVAEFTTWPVAVYLPRSRRASLQPLPWSKTAATDTLVRERLDGIAPHSRAWIIGLPPGAKRAARMASRRPDLRVVRHEHFGRVHLYLLQRP